MSGDPGDENDNMFKDIRYKSGEMVRNLVLIPLSLGDSLTEEAIEAVNMLLEWCEWKDIVPAKFGVDNDPLSGFLNVWVKGTQR